jgi:Domain of unknown function (DUF4136)
MLRIQSFARALAPAALLTLSSCATPFNAQVNRFQSMPVPQGQSFYVKAADPKLDGSLEFARYASLVSQKLAGFGYQPATSAQTANLVVTLDYGVDEGKEKVRSVPGYGYGGFGRFGYGGWGPGYGWGPYSPYGGYGGYGNGYRNSAFMFGYDDPFMFGGGYNEVESYTVYASGLDMTIARKDNGQHVFEGKAKAQSLNDNLTYLVPNLVEAMFTGFPGNSGETVKISIKPPQKK